MALTADFPLSMAAAPAEAVEELPRTGSDIAAALQLALALLVLGALLAAAARRREETGD